MINVVLTKDADTQAFETGLINAGVYYKKFGSGRIFNIDAECDAPFISNFEGIKSCRPEQKINLTPQFSTVDLINTEFEADLFGGYFGCWSIARICRRFNPFYKNATGPLHGPLTTTYGFTRTGVGVDCYLIDTGFNPNHVELTGRASWVSDGSTTNIDTASPHGSAVSSNMAGTNIGIARGANIFFVQSPFAISSDTQYIALYDEAYQHYLSRSATNRPAVINHSFGSPFGMVEFNEALSAMIGDVIDAGIVICAASGNSFQNLDTIIQSPAEMDEDMIAVGATNAMDSLFYFNTSGTATGENVDIYAPGVFTSSAYSDSSNSQATDQYRLYTGTSMASPYTAGVVACMLEGYQRLTSRAQVQAIKARLIKNSTKGVIRCNPSNPLHGIINNRLLYLNPFIQFEVIPGLNPL